MDWKLIFGLSLFGLAMGVATVFVIRSDVEPVFWLFIFLTCAYLIARKRPDRHFLHGLLMGSMPLPNSPRLMMACIGPVIGVISGLIIGLLAYAAGRLIKPRVNVPA